MTMNDSYGEGDLDSGNGRDSDSDSDDMPAHLPALKDLPYPVNTIVV